MGDVMNETMKSHLSILALVSALLPSVSACRSDKNSAGREANPVAMSAQADVDGYLIDDFTTGPTVPGSFLIQSEGLQQAVQAGGNIAGGTRCAILSVTGNKYSRPADLDIRDGHMVVDTGIHTDHASYLLYGWDSGCASTGGMDLNLSGYNAFRITFDALDLDTAGGIEVSSQDGRQAAIPLGVAAGVTFDTDVLFADLGDFDPGHVASILIEIESGGFVSAHDYAITSIRAVHLSP
jgi:hypothetical protein